MSRKMSRILSIILSICLLSTDLGTIAVNAAGDTREVNTEADAEGGENATVSEDSNGGNGGEAAPSEPGDVDGDDTETVYEDGEEYTLKLDANGGELLAYDDNYTYISAGTSKTITKKAQDGELIIDYTPADIVNNDLHYTFDGWWTQSSGGEIVSDYMGIYRCNLSIFGTAKSKTIYAHWKKTRNVVTFDAGEDNTCTFWKQPYGGETTAQIAKFYIEADGTPSSDPYYVTYKDDTMVFDCWMDGETEASPVTYYEMTGDTTLTAKYKNNYTVTAHYGDGYYMAEEQDVSGNTVMVKKTGDQIFKIPEGGSFYPVKNPVIDDESLRFDAWYFDAGYTKRLDYYNDNVTGDVELWARYAKECTVTFDAGDGYLYFDSEWSDEEDDYIEVPVRTKDYKILEGNKIKDSYYYIYTPEHEEKFFDSWYKDKDLKEKISEDELKEYVVSGNVTFYAGYVDGVIVTADPNGGNFDGSTEPQKLSFRKGGTINNAKDDLDTPSRVGYDFVGWFYGEEADSKEVNMYSDIFNEDTTIYAHWIAIHIITFDGNGGLISGSEEMSYKVYDGYQLGSYLPTEFDPPEGKAFKGWYKDKDCTQKIEKYEIESIYYTEDVRYYAGWEEAFTVTFDANGGKFADDSQKTVSVAKGYTIGAYLPTVETTEDKVFKGWFSDAACTNEIDPYKFTVTADVTIYAGWTECFIVTFHSNQQGALFGNDSDTMKIKVVKGDVLRYTDSSGSYLELGAPSVETFPTDAFLIDKWYTKADCTGAKYDFDYWDTKIIEEDGTVIYLGSNGFVPTSNMDFYAKWTTDTVNITFNANGGKFYHYDYYDGTYSDDDKQYTAKVPKGKLFGNISIPPMEKYKEGYDYPDWGYKDAACTEYINSFDVVTTDMTVYCKWDKYNEPVDPETIPVVFHAGEGYLYYDLYRKTETVDLIKDSSAWNYTPVVNINDNDKSFYGYYYDKECKNPIPDDRQSFEMGPHCMILLAEEDLAITDLYAGYGPAYKVNIYANGGYFDFSSNFEVSPTIISRENNEEHIKLARLEPLSIWEYTARIRRDGSKIFAGWYTDAACTQPLVTYNRGNNEYYKPTSTLTNIYAKWIDYEPVKSITISGKNTVEVGESIKLTATVDPSSAAGGLIWYAIYSDNGSSFSSPVKIESDGTVTGIYPDDVTIYAVAYGTVSNRFKLTVKEKQVVVDVPVKTVSIKEGSALTLKAGATKTLTVEVKPDDASDKRVSFSSDNKAVATVSSDGTVTAIAAGTAVITVSSVQDPDKSASITITVKEEVPKVKSVKISYEGSTVLNIGKTLQLNAIVEADEGADKTVSWTSGDEMIATVSAEGLVTAVGKGKTSIKAKAGDVEATLVIEVVNVAVTNIKITGYDTAPIAMQIGDSIRLSATVSPANATDASVSWSSTNADVVSVNAAGLVTAIANGEAEIKASANDGSGVSASVKVKVSDVEITAVKIRAVNGTVMVPGASQQLEATITPSNATSKALTWSVDNDKVASISDNGIITIKEENEIEWGGNASAEVTVITKAPNDVTSNKVTITVKKPEHPVEGVTIDSKAVKEGIKPGDSFRLTAVITPANATDKSVAWSSSNTDVATISQTGIVEVKDYGTTVINVKAGSKSADYTLKVEKISVASVTLSSAGGDNYLAIGKNAALIAIVAPDNASVSDIVWSSSNEAIATVDDSGVVSGISQGKVTITAASKDDASKKAAVILTVFDDSDNIYVEFAEGSEFTYTGAEIKPLVNVFNRGRLLMEGVDYTVKYSNNKNANDASDAAKAPKVSVTGKTIASKAEATFRILPLDIGDESAIVASEINVVSGKTAKPELFFGGSKLSNKDFSNPYEKESFTSSRAITVYGIGNFTGEREIWVNVMEAKEIKAISKIKVSSFKPAKRSYTGEPQKLTAGELVVVAANDKSKTPLTENVDYYVAYPDDITSVGKKSITIVGTGDYTGSVKKTYKIEAASNTVVKEVALIFPDALDDTADGTAVFEYAAGGVKPRVDVYATMSDGSMEVLSAGRDYKVTYKNNTKATAANKNKKAVANVKFLGNYKSVKASSAEFYIEQADLGDAYAFSQDKIVFKDKTNFVASVPMVDINGVTVAKNEYTVTYKVNGETVSAKQKFELPGVGDSIDVEVVVKATGRGNYTGEASSCFYSITREDKSKDMSKVKVIIQKKGDTTHKAVTGIEFTGKPIEIGTEDSEYEFFVYLGNVKNPTAVLTAADYTVEYTNNVKAGKATVVLSGNGENYFGSKTATFKIVTGKMMWSK